MRRAGAQMLSDYAGGKVILLCDCGVRRRYDADAMLARTGDIPMTDLWDKLVAANGCTRNNAGADVYGRCKAKYDIEGMVRTKEKARQP